jgi:hypothetical protein
MASRVGEQDVSAIHPASELENVFAFDPGEGIGDLVFAPVLPFRPPVAGISRKSRVTGKREGRQAGNRRILDAFEPGDARLPEQLDALPLKERRRPILAVHATEPSFVNQ